MKKLSVLGAVILFYVLGAMFHNLEANREAVRKAEEINRLAQEVAIAAAKEADEARMSVLLHIKMKTGPAIYIQNIPGDIR